MTANLKFKQELWERLNVLLRAALNDTLEREMEIEYDFGNWVLKRMRNPTHKRELDGEEQGSMIVKAETQIGTRERAALICASYKSAEEGIETLVESLNAPEHFSLRHEAHSIQEAFKERRLALEFFMSDSPVCGEGQNPIAGQPTRPR